MQERLAHNKTFLSCEKEVPRHDTSSISYRKCIPSNKFFFQAIYSQTYVSLSLPTPIIKIARSHLVVSRNFWASKHEAFDK